MPPKKLTNEDIDQLISEVSSITRDYKAAVIAADLVDHGFPYEDIYFKNVSIFRRFVSRDLNEVNWEDYENDNGKLVLELNREGLYDMLPEGLTHTRTVRASEDTGKSEFAIHRKQEEQARKFFSSFENEFIHRSLQLEIIARELYSNKNHEKTRDFFEYLYGDSRFLTDTQVLTLLHILPLSNKIRADVRLIADTLTKVLGFRVSVAKQRNKPLVMKAREEASVLNETYLGVDSIISDSCVVYVYAYDLNIHDIDFVDFREFYKDGTYRHVLDFILPYFFPVGAEVTVILHPDELSRHFKASSVKENCFLGFNTYI